MLTRLSILIAALGLVACPVASASDQIPGAPQSRPIVIRGGTVHVVDGPAIEQGAVLFDNGVITAVGKKVAVPEKAIEIDATGKHVYPGLIESITDLGLREISAVDATDDRTEYGRVNPNARSWVAVNPDSELIPVGRASGVLVAMTAPRGRWMRGQSAVIQLDGWTVDEMTLLAPAGLCVDWGAMPRERENFDDLLEQAKKHRIALKEDPLTPTDVRLESLLPLIDRQFPLIAEADRQHEIESAIAYAQSQNLRLVIYGGYDAERCAALLKRHDVPVIVDGTYRLPIRRDDPYDASYTLPSRLQRAGVTFALAGAGGGSPGGAAATRNLPFHAGNAVAYGLTQRDAVRAITLSAAEILGVADRVGSLTVGKDATLIIADGNILETETNVTSAYIQGRSVDLSSRHRMLYEKYKTKYLRRPPR